MLLAALTGGIASGKSMVAGVFEELGCYIHHADAVAHELMEPHRPAWKAVVAHFGPDILGPDNTINREKLGAIAFSKKKERRFLNELLHPLVMEQKKDIIVRLRKEGHYKIFVSEAALTVEAGYADFFDKIVVVYCPKEVQIVRLMERDRISRKEALKKLQSQMPAEEKLKYADYVVDTSGTIESTVEQAEKVFRSLMSDYENKSLV